MESVFKKHNSLSPFEYQFVDQEYEKKFEDESRVGKLSSIFAGLAIFISCLGIFGLASFMAEKRTKEIGIRKVMGASVISLLGMLSKDFILLVLISFVVSIPTSFWVMSDWLNEYHYRTEIKWWVFAVAGLSALVITLFTVSFHSIKAGMANPVDSLRDE